jgi:hypothetical protein
MSRDTHVTDSGDTVPGPEKVSHENQQREYKTQLWPEKHSKRDALSGP